jgi:quercetin dioxygenase-like cupin family protein
MSTKKHLVLDDDVHEVLKEKKELIGSSIKEIGNSVLRTSLRNVFLGDILGRTLVEEGLVSEDGFAHALEEASAELRTAQAKLKVAIDTTKKGTLVSGSLETRQLFRRSDGAFQVLECWTRDSRGLPMEAHSHAANAFFIMLQGRMLVTMTGIPYALRPLNVLQVPSGVVHSVKPLDADCHMLAVLIPAVPEYFGRSA